MPRSSLPRLLSSTATLHHRYFSSAEKLRNIWMSGLIDPSKATVSERYMLYTGDMKKMHKAKFKSELKDKNIEANMEEEQWRYWSNDPTKRWKRVNVYPDRTYHVSADITFFNWKHHKMSVIDTPDCVDFNDEVETALCAFDSAIFVLSSVGGVQSQSITARSKLQHHSAAIQVPIGLEDDFKGLVDLVQLKAYFFHGSNGENVVVEEVPADMDALVSEKRHELIKTVSEVDNILAESFCSDKPISAADLEEALRRTTIARKFIPVFMGSASKYKFVYRESKELCGSTEGPFFGLQLLWDGVLNYLPTPNEARNFALNQSKNVDKDALLALAFTLNRKYGPITYLRIYEGVIRKGDSITNANPGKTFKVPSSIEIRKDEIGVPHSIEPRKDEIRVPLYVTEVQMDQMGDPYVIGVRNVVKVPYSCEVRKDDFGIRDGVSVRDDEAIHEAHAGEIVALHDVNSASGSTFLFSQAYAAFLELYIALFRDTFTDGLVRYTKASIDVSGVQVSKVKKRRFGLRKRTIFQDL
ncbi:elongation factor G-2, mitochondrial [Trifolium repens]|nr:elongation factor G-2, mitochondrial [Trifolium repens]